MGQSLGVEVAAHHTRSSLYLIYNTVVILQYTSTDIYRYFFTCQTLSCQHADVLHQRVSTYTKY